MAKTKPPSLEELPKETYIRVAAIKREDDHWPAYQAEVIVVQGDKVISRELVDKPNTKIMAFAKAQEFIDDTE